MKIYFWASKLGNDMGTNMGIGKCGLFYRGIGNMGNGKDSSQFLYICKVCTCNCTARNLHRFGSDLNVYANTANSAHDCQSLTPVLQGAYMQSASNLHAKM